MSTVTDILYCIIIVYKLSSLTEKIKKIIGRKKDTAETMYNLTATLGCKLWPQKQQLEKHFTSMSF